MFDFLTSIFNPASKMQMLPGQVLGPNGPQAGAPGAGAPSFMDTNQGAGVGFDPASGGHVGFQMQQPPVAAPPVETPPPPAAPNAEAVAASTPTPRPIPGFMKELQRNAFDTQRGGVQDAGTPLKPMNNAPNRPLLAYLAQQFPGGFA